tara:strand:+ start:7125 stop:8087 length:963 start_codon:yes stop_codon:yes gene_type:complete
MKYSPILIVGGEPNSIFLEIFFKVLKSNKINSPIILISSKKLLSLQMKKLNFDRKINIIGSKNFNLKQINNRSINLIDIKYNQSKAFQKISNKSNIFIKKSFDVAFKILSKKRVHKFINGPISKKYFLNGKQLGMTEYISNSFKSKKTCMLIYNKDLSVSPITTHLPLKMVTKNINKKIISKNVQLINNFYLRRFKFKPRIAILGLNPHCESIHKYNEDEKILRPTVKILQKNYKILGPYPADTIFLKNIRKNFDVIVGMYHDQVLTPMKTLYEYDAINITLGLPFLRISPDHGPNEKMAGKNISNPTSLLKAIKFLDKN